MDPQPIESPPVESPPGALAEISQDERTLALLAHLSVLVLAIIGPLIIFLVKKDESEYVAFHALQALVYQAVTMVVVMTVMTVVLLVTFGLCFPIIFIAFLPAIGGILYGIKANAGSWEGYPLIENLGRPEGR